MPNIKKGGKKIVEIPEKYKLIKVIQKGEMASVVLAEHERLNCRRIIKIINNHHQYYEALIKEARILQKFRNDAIPIIYDIIQGERFTWLIEEYIEGESLKSYLKRQGRISIPILVDLSIQLCDILCYIHEPNRRVFHLDIKPDNILISDNRLKLIDFGSAICEIEDCSGYTIFGTKGFCAPEQKSGGDISVSTDIYAVGMTFAYMSMYIEKGIPGRYKEIIDCCVRKGSKTYESAEEVQADLKKIKTYSLKRHKEMIIGVAGVPSGHFSSGYAYCLAIKKSRHTGKSVLLLDCNEEENLSKVEGDDREMFVNKNLTMVGKVLPQEIRGFRGRGYNYIICDLGTTPSEACGLPFDEMIFVGDFWPWTREPWNKILTELDEHVKKKVVAGGDMSSATGFFRRHGVFRFWKKYSFF